MHILYYYTMKSVFCQESTAKNSKAREKNQSFFLLWSVFPLFTQILWKTPCIFRLFMLK